VPNNPVICFQVGMYGSSEVSIGGVVHMAHPGIGSAVPCEFRTIGFKPRRFRLVTGNLSAI
jgi:hypothetical protein